jgi:molybdate transport system substrate-binding protein
VKRSHAIASLAAVVAISGCGGSSSGSQNLQVSAASSLQTAFTEYADRSFPNDDVKQSFAGSDVLAAQIEQGAKPDVFAAADTSYPEQLHRKGLVGRPVVFTRNRLVLAVPKGSDIRSLEDVAKPGVSLVIGTKDVPVGSYTREVLGKLPASERKAILANVRSEEPDDASIVGKLKEGAADAAFVYRTDVAAAGGDIKEVRLPESLQPDVAYGIAVVSAAPNRALAEQFVHGLTGNGKGQQILQQAGFLPPG